MTPDACFIVLFALLTVTAYLLWITDQQPRLRRLLGLLAFASLLLAVVFHDLELARVASSEREVAPPAGAPESPPPEVGGTGAGA